MDQIGKTLPVVLAAFAGSALARQGESRIHANGFPGVVWRVLPREPL